MFHEFAKLLLDFGLFHDLLGVVIVFKAHCLVSDEEVPQQQRLLDLIRVDADCFQEGQSGQHTPKWSMYTCVKSTCKNMYKPYLVFTAYCHSREEHVVLERCLKSDDLEIHAFRS